MEPIVHQGLSNLVIQMGNVQIRSYEAKNIVKASIEPDLLNKQEIEANMLKTPKVLYNWWKEHSLWAKDLAIIYIKEAQKAYRDQESNWTQYLGWAFHFITDRATPYHSPNKLKPLINSIQDDFEEGANSLKGFSVKSQIAGGLLNVGANLFSKAIDLKINHDDFEDLCDEKWISCKSMISEILLSLKKPDRSIINLSFIEKKINYLHEKYKDISLKWINTNNNYEKYMAEIVFVMDLAYQFIFKE